MDGGNPENMVDFLRTGDLCKMAIYCGKYVFPSNKTIASCSVASPG